MNTVSHITISRILNEELKTSKLTQFSGNIRNYITITDLKSDIFCQIF